MAAEVTVPTTTRYGTYAADAPYAPRTLVWPRTAWGPVAAGAVAAISAQLLFTVLGLAIGATAVSVPDYATTATTTTQDAAATISVAAGVWWLVSGTVALLIGGMVLGRVASLPRSQELHLNAFVMWAVTAVFGFMVLWSGAGMGSMAGPQASLMSDWNSNSSNNSSTYNGRNSSIRNDTTTGATATPGTATDPANRTLENAASLTNPTARDSVNTVRPTAEQIARSVRTASWWSVIGLIMGIAASVIGAAMVAPAATFRTDVDVVR